MQTFRNKVLIFLILCISFLSYSVILYFSSKPQAVYPNESAQKGRILWQQKNCVSCHQLYGLGGHLGPDLTNITEKRTDDFISSILHTGTHVMPDFKLKEHEINEFIEFFKYTNSTGVADPKSFKKHIDGTISQ